MPINFGYADESDPGPYPIPADAPIEGGSQSTGDRHVIVVDRDACRDYELYSATPDFGSSAPWLKCACLVGTLPSCTPPLRCGFRTSKA